MDLVILVRVIQFGLLLVVIAALVFLQLTKRRIRLAVRVSLVLAGTCLIVSLVSWEMGIIWDGRYPTAEFQVRFLDENGKPVQGISLQVEDKQGHTYFYYPVTDYLPDRTPTSNEDGLMVFHHVRQPPLEFSGEVRFLFGVFPVAVRPGPIFNCLFLYHGEEVYRLTYQELEDHLSSRDELPRVRRQWKWPSWPMSELRWRPDETSEQDLERIVQFFDLDHDGKLGPEEAAAMRAATWHDDFRSEVKEEEIDFLVVKRTVTVRAAR